MASKQPNLDKKVNVEVSASKSSAAKKNAGQLLRKARLAKGYKVTQVVQKLNISEDYVKAIENNDFKRLPPELTYALGFVRSYAQVVDLDHKEIVELFKTDFLGLEVVPDPDAVVLTAPLSKPRFTLPFMYIALAGGALVLSMAYFVNKKNPTTLPDIQIPAVQ
jgi:transcriptional regulator with XRE-family HTH domain